MTLILFLFCYYQLFQFQFLGVYFNFSSYSSSTVAEPVIKCEKSSYISNYNQDKFIIERYKF